jgi:predicted outer membrane protein
LHQGAEPTAFFMREILFFGSARFPLNLLLKNLTIEKTMKINLNKTIIALGVCAFTAAAFGDDQMAGSPQMSEINMDTNQPISSQSFVTKAGMTDLKEIHAGEMALQKSDNSDVKSFARRIVSDHKKNCKKLQSIAEKEGLNFPDTNSAAWNMSASWQTNSNSGNYSEHANDRWHTNVYANAATENPDKDSPPHLATMLVQNETNMNEMSEGMNLESLSGADFDRAFASHMVAGHEKAIHFFANASANLQDADLKKFAEKTLPTLRDHLRMAQELQSKVGDWSASRMTNYNSTSK